VFVELEDAADHLGLFGGEHAVLLARFEDHPNLFDTHREVALAVATEIALYRTAAEASQTPTS
jgi:hypothetical protein